MDVNDDEKPQAVLFTEEIMNLAREWIAKGEISECEINFCNAVRELLQSI